MILFWQSKAPGLRHAVSYIILMFVRVPILLLMKIFSLLLLMTPLLGPLGRRNVISSLTLWQYMWELFHGSCFTVIFQNLSKKLLCLFLTHLHIAFVLHIISAFLLPLLFDQISIPSVLVNRCGIHFLLQYRDAPRLELWKGFLRTV